MTTPDIYTQTIGGSVAPGFEAVRDTFVANFVDGIEVGASVYVERDGDVLVDLWGGYTNREQTTPWEQDTLVNVYSTTKGIAALAFAAVVEAGHLSYDTPVRDIWPEFIAGRGGLTIAQLLSHQSGVPGVKTKVSVADMYDWPKMIGLLEQQEPLWEPGTAAGYHAIHWGYLVGELVNRTTGNTLGTWLRESLAQPLNADFHLGLPASEHHRVADLIGPNHARTAATGPAPDMTPQKMPPLFPIALLNPSVRPWQDVCSAAWRSAEIAAANGQANARGIGRLYAAAANGGSTDGIRVLNATTIDALVQQEVGSDEDLVLAKPMRRGRGVILNTDNEYGPNAAAFGHAGAGGSVGFADPDARIGFGYAMNQMQPGLVDDSRAGKLVRAVYTALG